jgi:hypothetical protein
MKLVKYIFLLIFLSFFYLPSYSQQKPVASDNCDAQGWCWGNNPEATQDHFAYFSDQYDFKEYQLAIEPLEWLLENAPRLHKNLYIKGEKIYKESLKKEEDTAKIRVLEDKLLALYQNRITYFGEEAKVLQKKGKVAYTILKNRENDVNDEKIYALYRQIFELNGNKTYKSNLLFLTKSVCNLKNSGVFSEDSVLKHYENILPVLNYNLAQKKTKKQIQKWKECKQDIEKLVFKNVTLNCQSLEERFATQFSNSKSDLALAKQIRNYAIKINCKNSTVYLKALETIFQYEPSANIASAIAQKYFANQNLTKALEFYQKGEQICLNKHKLAELQLNKAYLLAKMSRNDEARDVALLASLDAQLAKQAYTFVGNLYMQVGKNCTTKNEVEARAVYLAAYEMFLKAQNPQRMLDAQSQFPSMTDIFTHNYQVGDKIQVACWVGGFATIRKRPK